MSTSSKFPSLNDCQPVLAKLEKATDKQFTQTVLKLADSKATTKSGSYLDVRVRYCSVNIELNRRGLIAPAFRPFRKLTEHKYLSAEEELLGLDRQVIDLHWIYCQHRHLATPNEAEFKDLFSGDEFNFDMASEYAGKNWRAETKANVSLRLPEPVQLELSVLRGKKARDRLRTIEKNVQEMEGALRAWVMQPNARFSGDDIPSRLFDYRALLFGRGSPSKAVRFRGLMLSEEAGQEIPSRPSETMSKRKRWFAKNFGVSSW